MVKRCLPVERPESGVEPCLADLVWQRCLAGARRVWLRFVWKGSRSYLTVQDDGPALPRNEPLALWGGEDLSWTGRVLVQTRSGPSTRNWGWQLDPVGGPWLELKGLASESRQRLQERWFEVARGNLVLCEDLAGWPEISGRQRDPRRFSERVRQIGQFLSQVLHRLLEDRLELILGGHRVVADDPLRGRRFAAVHRLGRKVIPTAQGEFVARLVQLDPRPGQSVPEGLFAYQDGRLLVNGQSLGGPTGACVVLELPAEGAAVDCLRTGQDWLPGEVRAVLERLIRSLQRRAIVRPAPRLAVRGLARRGEKKPQHPWALRLWSSARFQSQFLPEDAPFRGSLAGLLDLLAERQWTVDELVARLRQPRPYLMQQLDRLYRMLSCEDRTALALSPDGRLVVLLPHVADQLCALDMERVEATTAMGDPVVLELPVRLNAQERLVLENLARHGTMSEAELSRVIGTRRVGGLLESLSSRLDRAGWKALVPEGEGPNGRIYSLRRSS
ncbi:MAG: hypothetical protein AMXMBFR33_67650 [Candidatus Xenobia bacterium]